MIFSWCRKQTQERVKLTKSRSIKFILICFQGWQKLKERQKKYYLQIEATLQTK